MPKILKRDEKGYDTAYIDRLSLNEDRVLDFANGLLEVAELDDPVGETLSSWTLDNGLKAEKSAFLSASSA